MSQQPDAAEHRAAGVAEGYPHPAPTPSSPWSVTSIAVLPGYRFAVTFQDGTGGTVDMSRLIHSPDAGVFGPLQDEALFAQAYIAYGAVTWPGQSPDLAPDAMHKAIAETGEWIV